LVVQSNPFNQSAIQTVAVAAVTSNLKRADLPGSVRLAKGESGIPKASVINLTQLHSIDRSFIEERIGTLSAAKAHAVKAALAIFLGLSFNP
jgi:mRNA interferase MazF